MFKGYMAHRGEREARKLEEYERQLKLYGCIPVHKAFKNYYYNVEEDERALKKKWIFSSEGDRKQREQVSLPASSS